MNKKLIIAAIIIGVLAFSYLMYRIFFSTTIPIPDIPSDTPPPNPPPPPPADICIPYTQEQKNADAQACADGCSGLPPSELGPCLQDCISSTPPVKTCP